MSIILPPAPPNPWKRLKTRRIYENPWMTMHEDEVIRPDGSKGIYGRPVFGRSIGTVVVRGNGDVLLVGQWRYLLNEYSWEIPTGGCEQGEDVLIAAQRELQEETGVIGRSWISLGRIKIPHVVDEGNLFLVPEITEGRSHQESIEKIQTHWLPLRDAIHLVYEGRITNWLSQTALLKAADVQLSN